MKQRVTDETVANLVAGRWEQHEGRVIVKLARDLRDCRALLAAVEPVVRAAVALEGVGEDGDMSGPSQDLTDAVDALPADVRKEYGTPPIDWDAPADPPAPVKDGAE